MTSRFMPLIPFNARAWFVLVLFASLPAFAQLAEGDAHWAARHEGGARVDAAIAAYQRAVAQQPSDLVAHARLLRAYRFKGAYIAKTPDAKKQIYTVAKTAGKKALDVLAARGVTAKLNEKQAAAAARAIPGAADVFLWDAINWGEWALAYGKMAAAREGAADSIRRGATIALMIDPRLEGGAPGRVLGRLHDQTPRIPFITGWASSKEAVRFLTESLDIDPTSKVTMVFLAEAWVSNESRMKPKAIHMLKRVISTPNNPEYATEEAAAVEDAKALLKKWGA
jgi:hypothetical protein